MDRGLVPHLDALDGVDHPYRSIRCVWLLLVDRVVRSGSERDATGAATALLVVIGRGQCAGDDATAKRYAGQRAAAG